MSKRLLFYTRFAFIPFFTTTTTRPLRKASPLPAHQEALKTLVDDACSCRDSRKTPPTPSSHLFSRSIAHVKAIISLSTLLLSIEWNGSTVFFVCLCWCVCNVYLRSVNIMCIDYVCTFVKLVLKMYSISLNELHKCIGNIF